MRTYPPLSADPAQNRRFGATGPRRGGSSTSTVSSGDVLAGASSPEGAQAANPGQIYVQTATQRLWAKITGTGDTGWEAQPKTFIGTGDPNGAQTGRVGDQFYATDTLTRYIKATGNETNTGWE